MANKIVLNEAETEFIVFIGSSDTVEWSFNIKVNGHKLVSSKSIRFATSQLLIYVNLGVYIDEQLTGEAHCKALLPKLQTANNMLA